MKYFIGIDGGGTKSHCVVIDESHIQLFECFGGATNFLMLGNEVVCETIYNLLEKCSEELKIEFSNFTSVTLGTTGAGRRNDAESLENSFRNFLTQKNKSLYKFLVVSDAIAALEGAFGGEPGCILIAGTGSICFGKDEKGNIHRTGGFGRFIGDEGSGFGIGRQALRAIAKQFDGRGIPTLLMNLFLNEFKITSPEQLITDIYKNNFDIASVSPIVFRAAEQGDKTANNILEFAADELVVHLRAIRKKIISNKLNVAFIGGLIANENIYSSMLRKKIAEELPDVKVIGAKYSPAFGAALIAETNIKSQNY